VVGCTKVKVFVFRNIKFQMPLLFKVILNHFCNAMYSTIFLITWKIFVSSAKISTGLDTIDGISFTNIVITMDPAQNLISHSQTLSSIYYLSIAMVHDVCISWVLTRKQACVLHPCMAELSETMPNEAKICFKADYFFWKNSMYLAIPLLHSKSY